MCRRTPLVIAVLIGLTSPSGGISDALGFLAFFATVGVFAAMLAAFILVAPLGTALGSIMLRLTPPGWWQGPATGVLVALTLVALTLGAFALSGTAIDLGTYAVAVVPVVLAPIAGAVVQRRILHWPGAPKALES